MQRAILRLSLVSPAQLSLRLVWPEQGLPPSFLVRLLGGPKDDARTDMKKKHESIAAKYRVAKPGGEQ
jgi:hypothetical protein